MAGSSDRGGFLVSSHVFPFPEKKRYHCFGLRLFHAPVKPRVAQRAIEKGCVWGRWWTSCVRRSAVSRPLQRWTEANLRACVHPTLHFHGHRAKQRHTTGFAPMLPWRELWGYRIAAVGRSDPTLCEPHLLGLGPAREAAIAMEGAPQLPTLFHVHTIWKATAGGARGLEVPGVPAGRPTPVAGGGRRGEPCAGELESKDPTQDPLESVATSDSLEAIAVPPPTQLARFDGRPRAMTASCRVP